MSIKPQNLTEIRDLYELRFGILSETIQKVCSRIESDELIPILREDSESREYIFERVREIFDDFIREDQEMMMQKITMAYEEKSKKIQEFKETIERLTKYSIENEEASMEKDERIRELNEKLQRKEEENQIFAEKVRELEANCKGMEEKNKELEGVVMKQDEECRNVRELREMLANIEDYNKSLLENIRSLEGRNHEQENINLTLQETINNVRLLEDKNRELEENLLKMHEENLNSIKDLKARNNELQSLNNSLQEQVCSLTQQVQNSLNSINDFQKKNNELQTKNHSLEEKILSLSKEITNEEKTQLSQINETLLQELEYLKQEFETLKQKLKDSSEKLTENLEFKANYKKKVALIEKLSQSKKKYKAKVEFLSQELKKSSVKNNESQDYEILRAENMRLESRNVEMEENFTHFQREMSRKYEELLEFSNSETTKRAEIERKYQTNIHKMRVFAWKVKEKLKEVRDFGEEVKRFPDFKAFREMFANIKAKTFEIPMIKEALRELNRRNEEISIRYLQKLEVLETSANNNQECLGKINSLSRKLKEMTELLNESEKRNKTQEEELKNLKKNQYNTRLLFEEKVYRLEKELSCKEKAQTTRKEETLYQNLQKKYRYHNLLRKNDENEENPTFGEIKRDFTNRTSNTSSNVNNNAKPNKRKLSLKEF